MYEQLKLSDEDNMVLGIAGNKFDLLTQEEVSEEEAKNFTKEIGEIFRLINVKNSKENNKKNKCVLN